MIQDQIVQEIRKYRKEHAEKYGNDLNKIFNALKKQEKKSKRKLINLDPKLILAKTGS
jgi:hypothetical protein